MSALADPRCYSFNSQRFISKLQKNQVDTVFTSLPARNELGITSSGESRFETEAHTASRMTIDFLEHQATRPNRNSAGVKRREALSDQVGIDKQWTAGFIGQEFSRKSRFARAVRAGNDDYPLLDEFRHLRLSDSCANSFFSLPSFASLVCYRYALTTRLLPVGS